MTHGPSVSSRPRPAIGPDNARFWEGCREHRLLLPWCTHCSKAHLPPGPICPYCWSESLEWREASGRGVISTFTVVHKAWFPAFADQVPYNVVQVELAEGPRLTSRLKGLHTSEITIGLPVRVDFEDIDDRLTMHLFRPV
jgi:uncharacterized protein